MTREPRPGELELIDPAEVTAADLGAEIVPESIVVRVYIEGLPGLWYQAARVHALRWPTGRGQPRVRVAVDLDGGTIAEAEMPYDPAAAALADARATREHMARWAAGEEKHRGEAGE